jgi:hypothetical protein
MAYNPRHDHEKQTFEAYWKHANPEGRDRISGDDAAGFFKEFSLEEDILKRIYNLTATTHDMDLQQFFATLRLISVAQHNHQIESLGLLQ